MFYDGINQTQFAADLINQQMNQMNGHQHQYAGGYGDEYDEEDEDQLQLDEDGEPIPTADEVR